MSDTISERGMIGCSWVTICAIPTPPTVGRLHAQLKTANAKAAQAIWRQARDLGLSDQLDKMQRMGGRCG